MQGDYGRDRDSVSDDSAAPDLIDGGPGRDTAGGDDWRTGSEADLDNTPDGPSVTLDGVANDGRPGEGDNVLNVEILNASRVGNGGTYVGTDGPDIIGGGSSAYPLQTKPVVLQGRGGDDFLTGGDENNVIEGGDGNDALKGDFGDDTLIGGPGIDTFEADRGSRCKLLRLHASTRQRHDRQRRRQRRVGVLRRRSRHGARRRRGHGRLRLRERDPGGIDGRRDRRPHGQPDRRPHGRPGRGPTGSPAEDPRAARPEVPRAVRPEARPADSRPSAWCPSSCASSSRRKAKLTKAGCAMGKVAPKKVNSSWVVKKQPEGWGERGRRRQGRRRAWQGRQEEGEEVMSAAGGRRCGRFGSRSAGDEALRRTALVHCCLVGGALRRY